VGRGREREIWVKSLNFRQPVPQPTEVIVTYVGWLWPTEVEQLRLQPTEVIAANGRFCFSYSGDSIILHHNRFGSTVSTAS
jgi:hypothetical protein